MHNFLGRVKFDPMEFNASIRVLDSVGLNLTDQKKLSTGLREINGTMCRETLGALLSVSGLFVCGLLFEKEACGSSSSKPIAWRVLFVYGHTVFRLSRFVFL